MKQRFKKLFTILLTASLCVPAAPIQAAQADASTDGIVWTEDEKVSAARIPEDQRAINFNEEWKFFLGDSSTAHEVNFIDASWEDVNLPHDFSITQDFTDRGEAESGFLLGGTGWYRKKFSLPESFAGKSIVLNFDGVYKDAEVYVNGARLGEHHYGYSPFSFDISGYLTYDGITENVIAVKAVNNIPSSRWYSGSGIYRDVTLIVADPVHVDVNGTSVTTPGLQASNGSDGTVQIKTDVKNSGQSSVDILIRNTVFEKGSATPAASAEASAALAAGETKTVAATAKVNAPKLWAPEHPNLYTVRTELVQDGKVIDSYDTEFGFKWYEFVNNTGFKLNGHNMKINGVCMHHDQGALGAAAYYDATRRQLEIMKDMGVNTIRVTHNPASDVLMDICNELGLLVIEEFYDGWAWPKNGNSNDFSVYFREKLTDGNQITGGSPSMTWAEFALKSVVKRDRNDASLILWSLGNEIQEGTANDGSWNWGEIADSLIAWTEELDTVHPVTSGSNHRNLSGNVAQVNQKIFEKGGVPGYNYGNIDTMNSLHSAYPVMLWSETASAINSRGVYTANSAGTSAIGGHLTSYDESCVGWGKTAHASMYPVLTNDYIAGECVWTGFDYIGEPTPWNGTGTGIHDEAPNKQIAAPNSSYFGIVETTGFPKDNYYLYRSQWNHQANTLHLVTAWDPDNMKVSNGKTPVWVYSNAAKVELYLDGQKIGTATRKSPGSTTTQAGHTHYEYTTQSNNTSVCTTSSGSGDQSLYSVFHVAFTAGTLSAKAFDENGTEITNTCKGNTSVSTPGAASKLAAAADKDSIDADGSSLSYITVDVTDAKGNLKTKAENTIRFSLTGDGEILGVDNGDQASVDKFQQRSVLTDSKTAQIKAYAGKALVIVRSTKNSGSFTLTAASDSLADASVTVQTKAVGSSSGSTITSYTMPRHCYLPAGTAESAVSLPTTVKAAFSDNTEKTLPVDWNDYDTALLDTKGNYRVDGAITSNGETINVSVLLHVYAPIIGVQNHSLCTAPNTLPALPTVSMAYDADGDAFEEFPIAWDMNGITASTFAEMNAVVPVEGTVTAFGKEYKTTASVRVAEPNVSYTNVATNRDHLVDNAFECGSTTSNGLPSYNDTLNSVTDGSRPDSGWSPSRWSDWDHRTDPNPQTNLQIAMDWATVTTTDRIDIYYFTGGGAVLPNSVKFEYAATSNYNEDHRFLDAEWKEIKYKEPVDLPSEGLGNTTVGKSYQLEELINPQAIRITFGHAGSQFMGLNEIEVQLPTYTYDLKTDASLPGVTLDGNQSIAFDNTTAFYPLPDGAGIDSITCENPNNAAVTILKRSGSLAKIISVSEDGQATKSYAITASSDIPTEAEKAALQTSLEAYKQLQSSNFKNNGYTLLQNKIQQYEKALDTMTKSDISNAQDTLQTLVQRYKKPDAKDALKEKINQIKAEHPSEHYTPESYKPLQDLMDEIERTIDTLTEAELADMDSRLDQAISNLVSNQPTEATRKILLDKIKEYKALDPDGTLFLKDGLQSLQTLADTAEQQIDTYTETALQAKIKELETAYQNLVQDSLEKALDDYRKLDSSQYTPESYKAFQDLLDAVPDNPETMDTDTQLAHLTRLADAYLHLEKQEDKKGPWTITFQPNGSGVSNLPEAVTGIEDGKAAVQPQAKPRKANYDFTGWSLTKKGANYDWDTPVTEDLTLYAQWKLTTRYIKFDANKGTGAPARIAVQHGSAASQPKQKPTRKGYTFAGWTLTKNGSVYNWSKPVTKDITLYAKWKKAPSIANGDKMTDSKTKITYKVTNASKKTVMVFKGGNKKAAKVTIPEKVKVNGVTCTVTEIGKNAFKGYTKLAQLKVGKAVKTINKNAFYGCKKLTKVTFQSTTAPSIKTNAFKKTSSKATVYVPKNMKSKERTKLLKALKKAGISKKVKIK